MDGTATDKSFPGNHLSNIEPISKMRVKHLQIIFLPFDVQKEFLLGGTSKEFGKRKLFP
jgi:hypothetical protein